MNTFPVQELRDTMDCVRANPKLQPSRDKAGALTTHCNENAFRVAQDLGLPLFWHEKEERIMLANEMVDFMEANPEKFTKFNLHMFAHECANEGRLVLAACKGAEHGHIAPVYPGDHMEFSGKWMLQVPMVSNVGIRNEIMGVNYAFADPPDYYLVA